MRFINKTNSVEVDIAILFINKLLVGNTAYGKLLDEFTYTGDTKERVFRNLMDYNQIINVKLYQPRWKYSKALAYWDGKTIYLNKYKILRSASSIAGSIMHEYCHAVGYRHGGNSLRWYNREKKYKSVPYALGILVKRLFELESK